MELAAVTQQSCTQSLSAGAIVSERKIGDRLASEYIESEVDNRHGGYVVDVIYNGGSLAEVKVRQAHRTTEGGLYIQGVGTDIEIYLKGSVDGYADDYTKDFYLSRWEFHPNRNSHKSILYLNTPADADTVAWLFKECFRIVTDAMGWDVYYREKEE